MDEKFDIRTLEHQIRRGVLSREEVAAYLSNLPDDAEEGVETETRFAATYGASEAKEEE